jgi:hypothetical protein
VSLNSKFSLNSWDLSNFNLHICCLKWTNDDKSSIKMYQTINCELWSLHWIIVYLNAIEYSLESLIFHSSTMSVFDYDRTIWVRLRLTLIGPNIELFDFNHSSLMSLSCYFTSIQFISTRWWSWWCWWSSLVLRICVVFCLKLKKRNRKTLIDLLFRVCWASSLLVLVVEARTELSLCHWQQENCCCYKKKV